MDEVLFHSLIDSGAPKKLIKNVRVSLFLWITGKKTFINVKRWETSLISEKIGIFRKIFNTVLFRIILYQKYKIKIIR